MFSTTEVTNGPRARSGARRIWAGGLIAALVLSACGGSSSAAPTTGPGGSGGPGSSATTTSSPGSGNTTGPGDTGSANGGTAFQAATTALNALDSYAFKVEIQSTSVSGSVTTSSHQLMTGVVENKPDKGDVALPVRA